MAPTVMMKGKYAGMREPEAMLSEQDAMLSEQDAQHD